MVAENHYLQDSFYDLLCNDPQVQEFFKNESIDGIWFFDPTIKEDIWVTVPFLKCLGYTAMDFGGQVLKWNRIIDPSDSSFFYRLYANQLKAGIQTRLSDWVYLIHQNGNAIPFSCKCILVENNQKLLGIVKRIKTNTVFNTNKGIQAQALLDLTNNFFILNHQYQFEEFLVYDSNLKDLKEDLIGKTFHQIGFPQEICNSIHQHLAKTVTTNNKQELDLMLTIENEETWFSLISSVWKKEHEPEKFMCIIQNKTKKHLEELDHYKQFKALENSIDGVAFLSIEGFCTYVNQGFAKMMGQQMEDLIGIHWRKVLMANEVKKFDDEIIPSLYSKGMFLGTINGSRKNGEIFPVSISLTVTPDFGIICVLRDLSEIQHMRVEISEKDQLLLQFIKEVPSATYLVEESAKGQIDFAFASDDFKSNFSYLLDEEGRLSLDKLIQHLHPEDIQQLKDKKETSKQKGTAFSLEARLMDNHHAYNWFKIKAQPVKLDDGSFKWYGTIEDISDKKLAQSQLLPLQEQVFNSESKYESLLTASQLGGWEYNKNTNELWCSHAYFKMLGLEKEYPSRWGNYKIQEVWEDLLHPEDLERAKEHFSNYLTHLEGTYSQEFRMKHANGSWVWISSRGKSTIDTKTKLPSGILIGAHIDITANQQLSEYLLENRISLLKNNALLTSIINSPENLYIVALDKAYQYIAFTNSYSSYAKATLIKEAKVGMSVFEVIPENLHAFGKANYDRALAGESFIMENNITAPNGKTLYYENRYSPIKDESGAIHGLTLFINDVTDIKQSQIAEQINKQRYTALFTGAQDAIFIAEAATGILVDMNQQAEQLMGYSKELLIGKHQMLLHPEKELKVIKEKFELLANSKEYKSVDSFIKQKSGEILPVTISAGLPFEVNGKLYAAAYFKDATKIIEARHKIDSMENLLERAEGIANLGTEEIKMATGEHVWSDVMYSILGLKPKSIAPRREIFVNLIHPDDKQKYIEWFVKAISHKDQINAIEIRITSMDGINKHLLISGVNQLSDTGEIMSHFGVFKDISQITNTIIELQQQNKQLKEIAWSQSHLVRAPLSRLLGLTQVFKKGILKKEEEKEFLNHIHQTAMELDKVITNIIYTANGIPTKSA
jgi:PAS domain S-box-containing protein